MIAENEPGQGGAASTDIDSIDEATKGKLTEEELAEQGLTKKMLDIKFAEGYEWTEGKISPVGGNNINDTR